MPKFKKHTAYPLYRETPLNGSGCKINLQRLPKLRKTYFYKEDVNPGGDAPKSFIRVYEYGECRRSQPKTWIAYIAKVGHKWYPMESITEYLINQIGEELGLNMAKSKLVLAGGQVRFLSRYFLNLQKGEQLMHGAQIYARHLEDAEFVELANQRKRQNTTQQLFTFQYTVEAFQAIFPQQHAQIIQDFVSMLLFDAIVGNNDRHFYNWGVITDLFGKISPHFSPVYDTARGLFWNASEHKIKGFFQSNKSLDDQLERYVKGSKPRVGWDGAQNLNHFQFIEKIINFDDSYCAQCKNLVNKDSLTKIMRLIDTDFSQLMSGKRLELIKRCIKLRIEKLQHIISS